MAYPRLTFNGIAATLTMVALLLAGCTSTAATPALPSGWHWHEGGPEGFDIALPPGWIVIPLGGTDSSIGEIRGDGLILHWDLGWYSNELPFESNPEYDILFEEIGGREAKLVRSNVQGIVGVHFPFYNGGDFDGSSPTRLTIFGEEISVEKIDIIVTMFRTIM